MVAHVYKLEEWRHYPQTCRSISKLLDALGGNQLLASFLGPASLDSRGSHHDAGYFSFFKIVVLLIVVIHFHSVTIYGSLEFRVSQ